MIERALTHGENNKTYWDDETKGLHLRISGSGTKSFFLYYTTRSGTERRPKLGEYPEMTLAQARSIARNLLSRVSAGEDPKGEWDRAKGELSVKEMFALCYQEHWADKRYQTSGWAKQVLYNFENHIGPTFGHKKLSEVTADEIRRWHKKKTPVVANRALSVLSKVYAFAEEQEYRAQNTNPCKLVKVKQETKRKRFATPEEMKRIAEILKREEAKSPAAVAFIYLLMFTGARPRSIERATWAEFTETNQDGERFGVLRFNGKTSSDSGELETVIVPPQVMHVIDRLPKNSKTLLGIKMPTSFWNKIREEAGCSDLWARDLRRTFATIGLSNGASRGVIGELLNHKSEQTTLTYAKVLENEKMKVTKFIADQISSITKGAKGE